MVNMMMPIKVLVVDDHPVFRQGVFHALESCDDIKVVGEAGCYDEALAAVRKSPPDVILLDLSLPGLSGIDLSHTIHHDYPKIKVVILSLQDREEYILRSLDAGAMGYVLKGEKTECILDAIHAVYRGEHFLCPTISGEIIGRFLIDRHSGGSCRRYDTLSDREQQVFRLLAEGCKTVRIAEMLCVSPKTIEKHRVNLMHKLKLDNLVELVKYAISLGIVDV
jgi:DNA-binding NarL/FixJ family response regulator